MHPREVQIEKGKAGFIRPTIGGASALGFKGQFAFQSSGTTSQMEQKKNRQEARDPVRSRLLPDLVKCATADGRPRGPPGRGPRLQKQFSMLQGPIRGRAAEKGQRAAAVPFPGETINGRVSFTSLNTSEEIISRHGIKMFKRRIHRLVLCRDLSPSPSYKWSLYSRVASLVPAKQNQTLEWLR